LKRSRLHPNVVLLGFVSLLTDFSSDMMHPTVLTLFLAKVLGVSTAFIGLIEGIAESTASLLKVASGYLSDRLRKRKALVCLGYSLSTLSKPFFALAGTGWHILALRFSERTGKGIRTAPRDALVADSTGKENYGRAFGFHRALDTAGALLGKAAAVGLTWFLLTRLKWEEGPTFRLIFLVAFLPALAAVILSLKVREIRPAKRNPATSKARLKNLPTDFRIFVLICVVFTLGNSSDAFLTLRADAAGFSPAGIILLMMLILAVHAGSSTSFGILSDRIGRRTLLALSFFIYALVYAGFAAVRRPWSLALLFAAYGLYYGMSEGTMRAYVADLVPSEARGTAYGIISSAIGLTALPASILMGLLWQKVGFRWAFSVGAFLAFVAAIMILTLLGRKASPGQPQRA